MGLHNFYQAPYLWLGHQGYDSNTGAVEVIRYDPATNKGSALKEFPTLRSAWSGKKEDSINIIGNLMVVNTSGHVATVDIGDPLNPKVLDVLAEPQGSYGGGLYGNRVFNGNKCFDISDPQDIKLVGTYRNDTPEGSTDRYHVTFQHGYLHVAGYKKINTQTLRTELEVSSSGEYAFPIGNLVFVCKSGASILVHQKEKDLRGPEVMTVNPVAGAVNMPLTSRIGVSLEEWPDARSISPSSFIVRKVGGGQIAGVLSCQWTIVNFSPNAPLEANTTYELDIPAGGIKDLVGNPIGTRFVSRFSTGPTVGGGGGTNTAPTISDIANQTVNEDTSTGAIGFTVGDAQTSAGSLTLSATSTNTALVPNGNISFGGSGLARTVSVQAASNQIGSATITISVSDGSLSASASFTLMVTAVNDAPTISHIADQLATSGLATAAIPFTVGDAETAAGSLSVSASSSSTTLLPASGIVLGGSGANRSITITPAAGQTGSAIVSVSVSVSDGALVASDSFVVNVSAPGGTNTAPTISTIADLSAPVGGVISPIAFTVGDAQTAAGSLVLSATTSNSSLLPLSGIVFGGNSATRNITLSPVTGQTGSATVSVRVSDGLLSATESFTLSVSAATQPIIVGIAFSSLPASPGSALTITANASDADGDTLEYRWDFSDGSAQTGWSGSPGISHSFATRGHYLIVAQVRDRQGSIVTASRLLTVAAPAPATRPTQSGPIAMDDARRLVWTVNRDGDTVCAIHADTRGTVGEWAVGDEPSSLCVLADGSVWVACAGEGSVRVLSSSGAALASIALGAGSDPRGICANPAGTQIYVACSSLGRLLRLDPATRSITSSLSLGPTPRPIAISADGNRIFVGRFVSPDARGEVWEVAASTLSLTRTHALAHDLGPDDEASGRGLPNYLHALAISPDGSELWVGGKKDNIGRGLARDGQALRAQNTVRALVCRINLATNAEDMAKRIDLDNRDVVSAIAFSPLGDWALLGAQGADELSVVDAFTGSLHTRVATGAAPQGVVHDAATRTMFSHDFLGRSSTPVPLGGLFDGTAADLAPLPRIATQAVERLAVNVLHGKRIFYNAIDPRMSAEGYLTCATCHADGGHDGRVWDFTDRGEGLRNTTDLRGRRGTGHGRVHWSANFDEIQDFEHDIRFAFGGSGFMSNADFTTGTRNTTLGTAKAGVSADLDALAAYVASLTTFPAAPERAAEGTLTSAGTAGRAIFQRLDCARCHTGSDYTDSARGHLHDVGTLKTTSGKRLGDTLAGIDTPTLKGLWATAPYLHDGSAADLAAVFAQGPADGAHRLVQNLTSTERDQLYAFLRQLDGGESAIPRSDVNRSISIQLSPAGNHQVIHQNTGIGKPLGSAPTVFGPLAPDQAQGFAFAVQPAGDG